MVITILEAHVSKENWSALENAYQTGTHHTEAGLVQSFLIQSVKDVELWRIVTIWRSQEALEAMRRLAEIPRGVLMFRDANADPVLSIFNIVHHIAQE
jgi:heme-degrading monooxygenase HmoA